MHMNSAIDNSADAPKATVKSHSCSAELYNDRTHDSTVDTDGKNHEAARIAGQSPIAVDEITISNATLVNSVAEALDGMADSTAGSAAIICRLRSSLAIPSSTKAWSSRRNPFRRGSLRLFACGRESR